MIEAPAPGLYEGVPEDTYHAWSALNSSTIKALRDNPPAKVRYEQLHPKDPTAAIQFGTAYHCALLEPDIFEARYVVTPEVPKRGAANLALWAEFEAGLAPDQVRIKGEDLEKLKRMRDAAYRHPFVRALLTGRGMNEVSVVFEHPVHGIAGKLRVDRLTQKASTSIILDLKKARNAGRDAFGRQVEALGYHIGAAWYRFGLGLEDLRRGRSRPVDRQFAWIAQEDTEPFLPAVWQIDPEDLADGEAECERLAALYAHCVQHDDWPGYTPGGHAQIVSRPRWARRRPDAEELVPPRDEEEDLFAA